MDLDAITKALEQTLDDRRVSRSERDALTQLIEPGRRSARELGLLRSRVFALAAERVADPRDRALIEWCEDVVKALASADAKETRSTPAFANFSPGDACRRTILRLIQSARQSLDICVFTITDDDVSDAIIEAHARGRSVRVVTDNDKAEDLGSDIARIEARGVPVVVDRTAYHMHHKFALFDSSTLLTGSYNWTRSAARHNEENLIVTEDERLVSAFQSTFDELWKSLSRT